jgi:hypothetical protein
MEFISSDEFGKKINEIYSSSKFEGKLMEFIHQVNLGGGENNGIFPSGKFEKIMGNCNLFIKQI